ncbi:MAG: PH domain-containing protein [Hyphomicrobiales bacterium]|nr:PH domain-containing protein [Hyphomicrobiales bacterium]
MMTTGDSQGSAGEAPAANSAIWTIPYSASAHWALFLPTVLIALLYGLAWLILYLAGQGDGDLARLCLVVVVVAPPLIGAYALFRYVTIALTLADGNVLVNSGGFGATIREIPADDIRAVTVKHGLVGQLVDMGTVRIETVSGDRIVVPGLASPQPVVRAISAAIEARGTQV